MEHLTWCGTCLVHLLLTTSYSVVFIILMHLFKRTRIFENFFDLVCIVKPMMISTEHSEELPSTVWISTQDDTIRSLLQSCSQNTVTFSVTAAVGLHWDHFFGLIEQKLISALFRDPSALVSLFKKQALYGEVDELGVFVVFGNLFREVVKMAR